MEWMNEDFLLTNPMAKTLFHDYAKEMPIIDYHNHLSPKDIYEDKHETDIAALWLGGNGYGDHYKWRIMRAYGVSEEYITGKASNEEKFEKWAEVLPQAIGNPLVHWTQLELKRYFGIDDFLCKDNWKEIYDACNAKLQDSSYSTRNLLRRMNVKTLCTTDDPVDDLHYHKQLKEEGFEIHVLPAFRPDKALNIHLKEYTEYIQKLSQVSGIEIKDYASLMQALENRIAYFDAVGSRVSDHALDGDIYEPATEDEINVIMDKAFRKEPLTHNQIRKYKGAVLKGLAKIYTQYHWAMQLHIGALRNNSTRYYEKLGADTGFDCMGDWTYMDQLSALMNAMDYANALPKTILYCLNPRDNAMLVSLAGCFMEEGTKGKVQFGSAWWFDDSIDGMEAQLKTLSNMGLLSVFVGMLTDSRSFLSFPRHEYFRRVLCNYLGSLVESGQYPAKEEFLGEMVQNIAYNNAVNYFGLGE